MPRRKKTAPDIPPPTAEERFEQVQRERVDAEEREVRQLFAEVDRQHRARQRRYQMDSMATWDEQRVGRLVAAGNLSAEDVELWAEARQELKRRVFLRSFGQSLAASTGRKVTIIE